MEQRLALLLGSGLLLTGLAGLAQGQPAVCRGCPITPSLKITRIEHSQPVEGLPIAISFEITNLAPLEGRVAYKGHPAPDGPVAVDLHLAGGETRKGRLYGLAPKAGQPIEIAYQQLQGEFWNDVITVGHDEVKVAACYEFRLDHFRPETTRDNYLRGGGLQHPKDYVLGSVTTYFDGQPVWHPTSSPLDDQDGTLTEVYGWYESSGEAVPTPNQRFRRICAVPGDGREVSFSFLLQRARGADDLRRKAEILMIVSGIGKGVATGLQPGFKDAWQAVDQLHGAIVNVALADCDGVLAAEKLVLSSALLAQVTDNPSPSEETKETPTEIHRKRFSFYRDRGLYSEERRYVGYRSPEGCGTDLSVYDVKFTIDRLSYPGR